MEAKAYKHNFTLDSMTVAEGIAFMEALNCVFLHISELTAANGFNANINAIHILDSILKTDAEVMELMKAKARILSNQKNILSSKLN